MNDGIAGTAPAAVLAPRSDAAATESIRSSEKSGGAARKVNSDTVERITANSHERPSSEAADGARVLLLRDGRDQQRDHERDDRHADRVDPDVADRLDRRRRMRACRSDDETESTTPVASPAASAIRVRRAALVTEPSYDFWIRSASGCKPSDVSAPERRRVRDRLNAPAAPCRSSFQRAPGATGQRRVRSAFQRPRQRRRR